MNTILILGYNGSYSLPVCASYFISCSVHTRFASVLDYLSIENGAGAVGIFGLLVFNVLYRSYQVNNKEFDVLYILMYYYTGILFVVLREGWVSYTSLFAGNLP